MTRLVMLLLLIAGFLPIWGAPIIRQSSSVQSGSREDEGLNASPLKQDSQRPPAHQIIAARNQLDRREPIVHIHVSNQVKKVFKRIGEGIKNIGLKVLGSLPTPLAIPARIASTAISIAEGVKKIKKAVSAEHKIKDAAKAANHANDAKNAVRPHR